ncbi:MAG: N5-glutamine methyltransferase family protein [Collinsella aerofaciens]
MKSSRPARPRQHWPMNARLPSPCRQPHGCRRGGAGQRRTWQPRLCRGAGRSRGREAAARRQKAKQQKPRPWKPRARARRIRHCHRRRRPGDDLRAERRRGHRARSRRAPRRPRPRGRLRHGCISLSLAWERRGHVTCTATDIEPRAIDLATKNRDALGLTSDEVAFSLTNLVSSIPREEWGTFDVLVSNPPYIPTDVMRSLPHEVKDFEPDLALEGGADGLDIFRRLLNAAPYMLRAGGLFACELYEGALDAAAELCRQAGLSDVRIVHDLTDRPRIVRAIVTEPKQRQ